MEDQETNSWITKLDDPDHKIRIKAINQLGESADELILKELRSRLKVLNEEHIALIIAVGKLKKSLGIK